MADEQNRYAGVSDRALLQYIALRVERLDRSINGNGRPGLVERVAVLEDRGTDKRKTAGVVAGIVTGVMAFMWKLAETFA